MRTTPEIKIKNPSWTALPAKQSENTIVVAGADGVVRGYSVGEGTRRWETDVAEEPLDFRVSDTHIVAKGRDEMAVVRERDGHLLWKSEARELVDLTAGVVLTQARGEVSALRLSDGATLWKAESLQPAVSDQGLSLNLSGERGRRERLEAREVETGEIRWSTTDGDIDHVLVRPDSILYTNQKLGRHFETLQFVTSRNRAGDVQWSHQCSGKLRVAPQYSPDGRQLLLQEVHPADPSRSLVTLLSTESGRPTAQFPAAHNVDATFLSNGRVAIGESDYSLIPDQGEKRLRVLTGKGNELWRKSGRPSWMMGGENLLTWDGERLSSLALESGKPTWQLEFPGTLIPVGREGTSATFLHNGCRLLTLDSTSGKVKDEIDTGHQLMLGEEPNGLVTDHEGQVMVRELPGSQGSLLAGDWKKPRPFHLPFLSGPVERNGGEAVFVDWDGDEKDDGRDPILLDAQNSPVSWTDLQNRDGDSDATLETRELADLRLWFDMDRDGKVSSDNEIDPLIAQQSFDKGRLNLAGNELWLASGSRCSSHE